MTFRGRCDGYPTSLHQPVAFSGNIALGTATKSISKYFEGDPNGHPYGQGGRWLTTSGLLPRLAAGLKSWETQKHKGILKLVSFD